MIELSSAQKKVLDIYHNEGYEKAWNFWKLIGNTYGIFLGEVPSNDFIDGEQLANHIGLTDGVLCNIDTPWLKFILDGNIIYVPMKPLMYSVSWDAINECGAVFENKGATINVGGKNYDITLLRGLNKNNNLSGKFYGFDVDFTHSSEWNRLMYPIHSGIHSGINNPTVGSVPFAQWSTYFDVDLMVDYHVGSATWIQEIPYHDIRLIRGDLGITYLDWANAKRDGNSRGWRPALRSRN